jgi:predicted benzoate:H+ symporter BenE
MAEQTQQAARADVSPLRSWIIRHPIATFLVLVYATTTARVFVPRVLTEPGLLPGGATPHGALENVLGSAVAAFIVTALVSGKVGSRAHMSKHDHGRPPHCCWASSCCGI